jgi:hypothetical protein
MLLSLGINSSSFSVATPAFLSAMCHQSCPRCDSMKLCKLTASHNAKAIVYIVHIVPSFQHDLLNQLLAQTFPGMRFRSASSSIGFPNLKPVWIRSSRQILSHSGRHLLKSKIQLVGNISR